MTFDLTKRVYLKLCEHNVAEISNDEALAIITTVILWERNMGNISEFAIAPLNSHEISFRYLRPGNLSYQIVAFVRKDLTPNNAAVLIVHES